jgi:hypothetical protein
MKRVLFLIIDVLTNTNSSVFTQQSSPCACPPASGTVTRVTARRLAVHKEAYGTHAPTPPTSAGVLLVSPPPATRRRA